MATIFPKGFNSKNIKFLLGQDNKSSHPIPRKKNNKKDKKLPTKKGQSQSKK